MLDDLNPERIVTIVTSVVTIASLLANLIAPSSRIGRLIHAIAANWRSSSETPPAPK